MRGNKSNLAESWYECARFLLSGSPADGFTSVDRQEALRCAKTAVKLSRRRQAFMLAMLARAYFATSNVVKARESALETIGLMNGHDAEWLTVSEMAALAKSFE